MLLVHSGNRIDLAGRPAPRFPTTQVPIVGAVAAKVLASLAPAGVVSAAAAGADLVVLGEAIKLGIAIHIVLPIAREEFLKRSVVDAGPEWVDRFDAALQHAATTTGCSISQGDDPPDHEWYLAAHDQLLIRAVEAAGGEMLVALTVRPPQGDTPPSVTDEFARRADRMGLLVLSIDPRPGASSTVTVS